MSRRHPAFLIIAGRHLLVTPTVCGCSSYFEGGVSSVYLWDLDHGFAGVILIKKAGDGSKKIKGCWDSIHVVEVQVRGLNWRGCADIQFVHIVLLGYSTEISHSCWPANCFLCRRSPAADLLTINSPPLSCCGSRQPKLVPVLWTWGAASQDRYDAQPLRWLTGFTGYNLFPSFLQTEKDETVGESSPHIANIGRLVEVSWTANRFFIYLELLQKHCSNLNSLLRVFLVLLVHRVSCLWKQALPDSGMNPRN